MRQGEKGTLITYGALCRDENNNQSEKIKLKRVYSSYLERLKSVSATTKVTVITLLLLFCFHFAESYNLTAPQSKPLINQQISDDSGHDGSAQGKCKQELNVNIMFLLLDGWYLTKSYGVASSILPKT